MIWVSFSSPSQGIIRGELPLVPIMMDIQRKWVGVQSLATKEKQTNQKPVQWNTFSEDVIWVVHPISQLKRKCAAWNEQMNTVDCIVYNDAPINAHCPICHSAALHKWFVAFSLGMCLGRNTKQFVNCRQPFGARTSNRNRPRMTISGCFRLDSLDFSWRIMLKFASMRSICSADGCQWYCPPFQVHLLDAEKCFTDPSRS